MLFTASNMVNVNHVIKAMAMSKMTRCKCNGREIVKVFNFFPLFSPFILPLISLTRTLDEFKDGGRREGERENEREREREKQRTGQKAKREKLTAALTNHLLCDASLNEQESKEQAMRTKCYELQDVCSNH